MLHSATFVNHHHWQHENHMNSNVKHLSQMFGSSLELQRPMFFFSIWWSSAAKQTCLSSSAHLQVTAPETVGYQHLQQWESRGKCKIVVTSLLYETHIIVYCCYSTQYVVLVWYYGYHYFMCYLKHWRKELCFQNVFITCYYSLLDVDSIGLNLCPGPTLVGCFGPFMVRHVCVYKPRATLQIYENI